MVSALVRLLGAFFKVLYYLLIEYAVIVVPFVVAILLPVSLLVKAFLTIVLLVLSIRFYINWRKKIAGRKHKQQTR